ncbi:MAG: hypothetical protein WD851_08355 [Pirellulales bacterium]
MKQPRNRRRCTLLRTAILWAGLGSVCACAVNVAHAQDGPQWALSSYRTKVVLILDVPPLANSVLQSVLPRHLEQRTTAAIGPLWDLLIVRPTGAEAHRLSNSWNELPADLLASLSTDCDKLVVLVISADGQGYRVRCKAYDTLLRLWTSTFDYEQGDLHRVPETAFWALRETFAPVAYFQSDPGDDQQVVVSWKGSALPAKDNSAAWIGPGDILLPVMRRTNRDGSPVENGIQQVPWTYLQMSAEESESSKARVFSHTKRPFGARRRGTVEQNAILSRGPLLGVVVQLQSRTNNNLPLAGFDVYRQVPGQEETTWIGKSNLQGEIQIPPDKHPLEMVFVKSGSQVVAKLPIAFNTDRLVKVPLVDDPVRLQAEAKINLVREQLIDLVARRTILAARVRQQIKDGKLDVASSLVGQLEEMPGRAQFDQMLAKQEQLSRSSHPIVQKRIDKLFADTRVVLGHFLDARLATDLRTELSQARQSTTQ